MNNDNIKLHLGCGDVYIDDWINIDIDSAVADLQLDLRDILPFDTESVSYIFAEHFIEHLTQSDAKKLLVECNRVLKKNGVLRLTTPNLYILVSSYLKGDINEWSEYWMPPTRAHMMNEGMRSWGHHFIYDGDEISRFLIECGFNNIQFKNFGESEYQEFKNIEHRNFHKEIIVEVSKLSTVQNEPIIDIRALRNIETQWSEDLNDKSALRIKELENKLADLVTHIDNQNTYINDLRNHILNLNKG